jgi:hypothetical protein
MKQLLINLPDDMVRRNSIKRTLAANAIQWAEVETPTAEDRAELVKAVADARATHTRATELIKRRLIAADYAHAALGAILDLVESVLDGKVRL